MRIPPLVAGLAFGVGIVTAAGIAQARSVEVEIYSAPPPGRVEVVPADRPGYVYERGHYAWDGHAYVWSEGRYIEMRQGHTYVQPMVEHRGEHYYYPIAPVTGTTTDRSAHRDDD
jgi:hypothetical protein